uniref:Uncharacterized protein n=1 Tax=Schizaphis graminum TaxID=13262 RepID=A0A2S2PAZ7_SCHGA
MRWQGAGGINFSPVDAAPFGVAGDRTTIITTDYYTDFIGIFATSQMKKKNIIFLLFSFVFQNEPCQHNLQNIMFNNVLKIEESRSPCCAMKYFRSTSNGITTSTAIKFYLRHLLFLKNGM